MKVIFLVKSISIFSAPTKRVLCYSNALLSSGVTVDILCYSVSKLFKISDFAEFEAPVKNIGGFTYRWKGVLGNFQSLMMQILLLFDLLLSLKHDDIVVFYDGGHLRYLKLLIKIVHFKHARFFKEQCELPYGTREQSTKLVKLRENLLTTVFPKLDGIFVISAALEKLAKQYCSQYCKIIRIPILVDFAEYDLDNKSFNSTCKYIFHSGTLFEQKDGIVGLLDAFGKAVNEYGLDLYFISTGDINKSRDKDKILSSIHKNNIQGRVKFLGFISIEDLRDYLSNATMCIINKYPNLQNTYCFSTKLAEYLASGTPVIITDVGEAVNWLENNRSAFIVKPNNIELLAEKISFVYKNPDEANNVGQYGKIICKKYFDYKNWGASLTKELYDL